MIPRAKVLFVIACSVFLDLNSEVIPKENSFVNYTTVYFEEQPVPHAVSYELIYRSDRPSNDIGNKPMQPIKNSDPGFFVSGLNWATRYFWRVRSYDAQGNIMTEGPEHSFGIVQLKTSFAKINRAKLDVIKNDSLRSGGGLIIVDYTRSMFTRQGKEVWALPDIPGLVDPETQVRDIKITNNNTITFLTPRDALEIDFDANVVWKAPSPFLMGKDTISYHHDFKKTTRGTYMVLGLRKVKRLVNGQHEPKEFQEDKDLSLQDGKYYKTTPMSVLLEFDKNGKLLWFWDANDYITDADLAHKKHPNGLLVFLTHANAFSENEAGTKVYVGFRDLSRIVRINKATKKVEYSLGEKFPSGETRTGNNLFRRQHDATITKRNTILLFNNNESPGAENKPKKTGILEIKDENTGNDKGLVWRFDLDTLSKNWSSGGGNVTELPNGNLLLCTGVLNKILEVDREGKIAWEAQVMSFSLGDTTWRPFPQYRCSWLPQIKRFYFIASKGGSGMIKIHNTGNASDTYLIELRAGQKLVSSQKTQTVLAGETITPKIKTMTDLKNTEPLEIHIRSVNAGNVKILPFADY